MPPLGKIPDIDTVITTIRPWMRGFIRKEYGSHVHPSDMLDLEQEGYTSIISWMTNKHPSISKLNTLDEFYFYAKAIARNAIRDYTLKYNSKFNISLFKLRREMKKMLADSDASSAARQRLGHYMHTIGDEFKRHVSEVDDSLEVAHREYLLSIISDSISKDKDRVQRLEAFRKIVRERVGNTTLYPPEAKVTIAAEPVESLGRYPIPSMNYPDVICANRMCRKKIHKDNVIVNGGFGYCSTLCQRSWPPAIIGIEAYMEAPLDVVMRIGITLYGSRKATAEVLGLSLDTVKSIINYIRRRSS